MAALGKKPSLARGVPFLLAAAVAGANTIDFAIAPYPGGRDFTVVFQAVGTLTTLASALQISLDNGTTFVDYVAAAGFLAAATSMVAIPASGTKPMVSGVIFRINVTAATGPCDIWVVIN